MTEPAANLKPLTPEEDGFLRELGRVIFVLPALVDADLVREQQLTLSEYRTLVVLSEAPDRSMRMSELAGAADLSLSGMTRLVARLENRGLIARVKCGDDARGWNAVLTPEGLARQQRAAPTNLASARRHLLDHLQDIDLIQLTKALRQIKSNG
jgi:DNA-binding MarR family transcriptional regulator